MTCIFLKCALTSSEPGNDTLTSRFAFCHQPSEMLKFYLQFFCILIGTVAIQFCLCSTKLVHCFVPGILLAPQDLHFLITHEPTIELVHF